MTKRFIIKYIKAYLSPIYKNDPQLAVDVSSYCFVEPFIKQILDISEKLDYFINNSALL
jgi:hypothetical protein